MQHVAIFKVNEGVHVSHGTELLSDDQLTRLTGEQGDVMAETLVKPIKFRLPTNYVSCINILCSDARNV